MIHRILGKTNLRVSAIGYGGSSLGSVFAAIDEQEGIRSVHAALDAGINLIDTAPYYGATRAETVLGKALKGVSRDRYVLATKVARYGREIEAFDFTAARVIRSVDESLERLGVDHVDLIQVHDIEFGSIRQVIEETVPALQQIKASGKARFVGITGLHVHLFKQVLDAVDVDVVQSYCHCTLNDTALLDVVPYLKAKNLGILSSAPFAMRLLTDEGPPDWHPAPTPLRERCAQAAAFCRSRGARLSDLALQFSVQHQDIHTHVVGTASAGEVLENVRTAFAPINEELLAGVLDILKPVHNVTWESGRPENAPGSRALRIEAPGKTAYGVTAPASFGADEVLVQVKRIGYCGSDLSTFRGLNPLVTYPRIPGHEVAGVIIAKGARVPATLTVGENVTLVPYTSCGACPSCRAGRENACEFNQTLGVQRDGALTDRIAVPWRKIVQAPLTLAELALVEPLSVGFHAVRRGRVEKTDTVLVFGCGMIGLGAIAAAGLHRGATVIAADIDDRKLALARRAGATHTINSRTTDLHHELKALSRGGPTVVIEAVGAPETFQAAVREVSFAGRVVYIGYAKAPVTYETKYFVMKELDILGSRNAAPEDFAEVVDLLRSGLYPSTETITRTVPWSEAGEALAAWSADPGKITKIHVDLDA